MPEHELEKLLGGFAADTLTPQEKEALFRAALHDQELFNALADEQALRELLANPAVRRKLLETLARQPGTGSRRSWFDRFTQPAGLAWAGGVAVGLFAVVLGLKVYQDSVRQAAETAVSELERVQAPLKNTESKASRTAPTPETAAKDAVANASREKAAVPRPQQEPRSSADDIEKREPSRQKEPQRRDAPVDALSKSTEKSTPAVPPSESDLQLPAQEKTKGSGISVSARALFYRQPPAPEKTETFALARKAPQSQLAVTPLALRYSLVGEEGERLGTITLTVEPNQAAYIQIWRRTGEALPELVLPAKETGRISLKTTAGERQRITVPPQTDRLIVRLSRVAFGPISRQEAVMAGRGSAGQVVESITAEEQATYVANPDVTAAELAIEIPVTAPSFR